MRRTASNQWNNLTYEMKAGERIARNTPKHCSKYLQIPRQIDQKRIQNLLEINPRGTKGPQATPRGKMSAN